MAKPAIISETIDTLESRGVRLADFLATLHDGVIVFDRAQHIKFFNERLMEMLNLTPDEISIGQSLTDILTVLARSGSLGVGHSISSEELIRRRRATWGTEENRVERRTMPDGRVLDIYRTVTLAEDVIAIHVDVTENVRKAEELERQRLYMVSVLENTTDGIALLDRNGRFVMFNDRVLDLYDVDPKSVYWGMDYRAFAEQFRDLDGLTPDERTREIENRYRFAFDPDVSTIRRRLANGRTLNVNKQNLPGGGSVMTYRDITAELMREQELIDARVEAEESNRHKSEFVARMSHEMRTPLNGVLGVAALLKNTEGLADREKQLVEVITDSGKVLLRLIDDILDLSRLDAGTFEVVHEDFELPALVSECVRMIEPSAKDKDLDLRVIVPDMPFPALRGDPVRIKQVLLNLLTNAVKFTEKGHIEVDLGCRTQPNRVSVFFGVSDTGVGIDNDKLDQIFNRFYQIDGGTTRKYGGAGLGLAITQKLVETMGGTVQVASQKGHGTTFRIRLTLDYAEGARTRI